MTSPSLHQTNNNICSSSSSSSPSPLPELPLREIPGTYGLPLVGAVKDRWDFFYIQGQDQFFKSRMTKYNSTVFRANMPPGPFISSDPRVIVVLDAISFPILFDTTKVEKRDVLTGTYMPFTLYTGGYRACAYLDPSESKHKALKAHFFSFLASKHQQFIPLFRACLASMFDELEDKFELSGRTESEPVNDASSFEFVFRLFCGGRSTSSTKLKSNGPNMVKKWLIGQLAPVKTIGLPKLLNPIEDLLLHTFNIPFCFVHKDYKTLYGAFYSSAASFLDKAVEFGLSREEACHNLVFLACFNAFGGFMRWFPSLIKYVAGAGETLHHELANEIRTIVKSEGGITLTSINKMELTKSVVYEALRIDPPVPFQYAKAREDLVIQSHEASFMIKKGEMLFGFQPFATRDPKVFDDPKKFVGDTFVGEKGEKLIKYVLWSNGREIDDSTVENKQCAGKDLVVLLSRVLIVDLFLRYDSFAVESKGSTTTFVSLTKAKSCT